MGVTHSKHENQIESGGMAPKAKAMAKQSMATLFPVGDSTVETYFKKQLSKAPVGEAARSLPSVEDVQRDIVAAAIMVYNRDDVSDRVPPTNFIPLLTRCITKDFDFVNGADSFLEEEAGISALQTPVMLQVLVATALKHRNKDLLAKLVKSRPPPAESLNIFQLAKEPAQIRSTFASVLQDPNYGPAAWSILSGAGWAPPLPFPELDSAPPAPPPGPEEGLTALNAAVALVPTDPTAALAALDALLASGWAAYPSMGGTLNLLVQKGTAAMVTHYLPFLPRSYFDGVPPRPAWPGETTKIQMAAARPDPPEERLAVVRALVEIGGLDVNGTGWYRAGPDPDFRSYETKLADGSCANETALHAAAHRGDAVLVEYLLGVGARRSKDDWGRDACERAKFRGFDGVVRVFEACGWK